VIRSEAPGVVLGMSGGVDSSTAAWTLSERGFRVVGVTLRFYCYARAAGAPRACCSEVSLRRARALASRLGIEHRVIDAEREFREAVVANFLDEYRRGRTPNPCIVCNERVKFPALARVADLLGFRFIATGHYARLERGTGGKIFLAAAADAAKDQSYFLYRVPVKLLERTLFPLGGMSKSEVKRVAVALDLPAAGARESQDVCFLPEGNLGTFLSERLEAAPGEVVDRSGRVLGTHEGVFHYTIGQRKGFGIAGGVPLYVGEIEAAERRIVLEPKPRLFHRTAVCANVKLRVADLGGELAGRVRYRRPLAEVERVERAPGRLRVLFREPQWAITPGQSLVLYRGGLVVGGGIVERGWAGDHR
jgi:tRNA-specific 2-thiouridylase